VETRPFPSEAGRAGYGCYDALIGRLAGGAEIGDALDMDVVLPRIADMLLDSRLLEVGTRARQRLQGLG